MLLNSCVETTLCGLQWVQKDNDYYPLTTVLEKPSPLFQLVVMQCKPALQSKVIGSQEILLYCDMQFCCSNLSIQWFYLLVKLDLYTEAAAMFPPSKKP